MEIDFQKVIFIFSFVNFLHTVTVNFFISILVLIYFHELYNKECQNLVGSIWEKYLHILVGILCGLFLDVQSIFIV